MKKDYGTAESHVLYLTEGLSIKETIHLSFLLLVKAAQTITDKRTRRLIEILARDVQKLEEETRE